MSFEGRANAKLGSAEIVELERVKPSMLDGVLWEDRVRVCKTPRGRYAIKDSATGAVLARFDLIDEALREAQRYNRERWR